MLCYNSTDEKIAMNTLEAPTSHQLAQQIEQLTVNALQETTAIPGLMLHRWTHPTDPVSYLNPASICLIAQGVKQVVLGEEVYIYDAQHFLLYSTELPIVAQILEASPEQPYLGLTLKLDITVIAELLINPALVTPRPFKLSRGIALSPLSLNIVSCVQRLLALLDNPQSIPILAPLIQREIAYWLLMSEQGGNLRQIAFVEGQTHQIARAVDWLKTHFNQPVQISELAQKANMSSSAFYQHFRTLTAMSPLQFQKRLRLTEARRLMLAEQLDVSNAAFQVGYGSVSQFNREYRRLFGEPPLRDIGKLRKPTRGVIKNKP